MELFDLQIESEEPSQIVNPAFTLDDSEELTLDKIKEKITEKKSIVEKLGYSPVIVICITDKQYSLLFLQNFMKTIGFLLEEKIRFVFSATFSKNIDFARCACLGAKVYNDNEHQLPFEGNLKYTHILWLSADVIWSVEDIKKLLLRNVDIVSGICNRIDSTITAIEKVDDFESYKKNKGFTLIKKQDIINKNELVEVQYSSMDFMLVKKGVFEKIDFPWFRTENNEIIHSLINEQMYFCNMARNNGFKIYIDPKVNISFEYV